jgi:Recombination endonuclease VII
MAAKSEWAKENARRSSRDRMRRLRAEGTIREPRADELTPEQLEKRRAKGRRYYARNRERRIAESTTWKKEHPEQVRQHKKANRKRERAMTPDPQTYRIRKWRHGPGHEAMWVTFWDEQNGLCYLCGDPLNTGSYRDIHVDHDHTCCPKGRTCEYCRRGLACSRCNTLIGAAEDNPDLLRRIADNLEPVLRATRARIATKGQQDTLWPQAG